MHEPIENARALPGVGDLGMELQPVKTAVLVGHPRQGRAVAAGDQLEPRRQLLNAIAMAHPHIQQTITFRRGVVLDVTQQPRMAASPYLGITEFAVCRGFYRPAQLHRHGLHPIADTQHRYAQFKHQLLRARRLGQRHRLRPPREDDALGIEGANLSRRHIMGMQFAIHAGFAHPARDQLSVLGTKVEDEDAVLVDIGHG